MELTSSPFANSSTMKKQNDVKKALRIASECLISIGKNGGRCKFRTCDPHSVKTMAVCQFLQLNQRLNLLRRPQSSIVVV